jgi:hypothetical protein
MMYKLGCMQLLPLCVERDVQQDPRKCHLLGFLQVRMSPISLRQIVMVASLEFYVVSFSSMMWIVI